MSQLQTTFAYLSIHGLQQIGRTSTKTIFSAIRWIAAFSFALIILIYHLYTVWEYFVDEPLIVDVEVIENMMVTYDHDHCYISHIFNR